MEHTGNYIIKGAEHGIVGRVGTHDRIIGITEISTLRILLDRKLKGEKVEV
jgi:hypothetical protein